MSDSLITRWVNATVDPAMRDQAELEIRRMIAESEAEVDRAKSKFLQDKGSVTRGFLEHLIDALSSEIALENKLQQRIYRKAHSEQEIQIARQHNHIVCLEARIKRLEAKAFPKGGGAGQKI